MTLKPHDPQTDEVDNGVLDEGMRVNTAGILLGSSTSVVNIDLSAPDDDDDAYDEVTMDEIVLEDFVQVVAETDDVVTGEVVLPEGYATGAIELDGAADADAPEDADVVTDGVAAADEAAGTTDDAVADDAIADDAGDVDAGEVDDEGAAAGEDLSDDAPLDEVLPGDAAGDDEQAAAAESAVDDPTDVETDEAPEADADADAENADDASVDAASGDEAVVDAADASDADAEVDVETADADASEDELAAAEPLEAEADEAVAETTAQTESIEEDSADDLVADVAGEPVAHLEGVDAPAAEDEASLGGDAAEGETPAADLDADDAPETEAIDADLDADDEQHDAEHVETDAPAPVDPAVEPSAEAGETVPAAAALTEFDALLHGATPTEGDAVSASTPSPEREPATTESAIAPRAAERPAAESALVSRRIGEISTVAERETPDLLTADRLLEPGRVTRPEPEGAWSHFLYALTGGRVNIGDGKRARARKELDAKIAAPLPGGARFVAVVSRKGGVGKTTVTTLLGQALADAREDRVIAVDANPDRGTLSERIARSSGKTVRDLVRERDRLRGYNDISHIVARDETRLDVLASDTDPRVQEAFSDEEYLAVAEVAAHYYSIVLTDTGTGIVHSVMGATLNVADHLVVVAGPSIDEAKLASETLTWLEMNGYEDAVRDAIVVINQSAPGAPVVRLDEIESHFRSRVRDVVRIPYDTQIATGGPITFRELQPATREAARRLAAKLVEGLRSTAASGH